MSPDVPFLFSAGGGSSSSHQQQTMPIPQGQQTAQSPGFDMSILNSITPEQLMKIGQLFQSGVLSLPPPPPGNVLNASSPLSLSASSPTVPPKHSRTGANVEDYGEARRAAIDTEHEGAELEDGEVDAASGVSQPMPTGRRDPARGPLHGVKRFPPAAGILAQADVVANSVPRTPKGMISRSSPGSRSQYSEAQSKQKRNLGTSEAFLLALHSAGYTFDQVAAELKNDNLLRQLYDRLGLPTALSTRKNVDPPRQEASAQLAMSSRLPMEQTQRSTSGSKRSVPVRAPAPVDRSAYLAKLQAAKKKSQAPATPAATTVAAASAPRPVGKVAVASPELPADKSSLTPVPAPSSEGTSTPVKLSAKNELIRQRLEALKAAQARKSQVAAPLSDVRDVRHLSHTVGIPTIPIHGANTPTTLSRPNAEAHEAVKQAAHIETETARLPQAAVMPTASTTPPPPIPVRTFSGLPGLFMSASPYAALPQPQPHELGTQALHPSFPLSQAGIETMTVQIATGNSALPHAPLAVPRRRDDVGTNGSGNANYGYSTPIHPFRPNEMTRADDSVIIINSDDEADDDQEQDMDIDEDDSLDQVSTKFFPTETSLPMTITASGSTPGADLKRKLQEIQDAKRKLEEAQKRQKLNRTNSRITVTPIAVQAHPLKVIADDETPSRVQIDQASPQLLEFQQQKALEVAGTPYPVQTIAKTDHGEASSEGDIDDDEDLDALYEPQLPAEQNLNTSSPSRIKTPGYVTLQGVEDARWPNSNDESEYYSDNASEADPALAEKEDQSASIRSGISASTTNADTTTSPGAQRTVDYEFAPELQTTNDQHSTLPTDTPAAAAKQSFYSAWNSPLMRFKDYRYHPMFLETVAGGHKSFTYSHRIDPNKPLCRFEAAGGKCNDKNCAEQHWRDMALSDNDLLRIMGAEHVPAGSADAQQKWRDGLGLLIRQLRATNLGKDAASIAARITEFRRVFLGDESRVLRSLD